MTESPEALARLAALDEPLRRRLFAFVRRSPQPVSREAAAEEVGIGRSLAAYHLDRLVEHGLLVTSYSRPEGRAGPGAGRPAKRYAAAEGELAVSVPARDYEFAAHLFAEAAESEPGGAIRPELRAVATARGRAVGEELREQADASSLAEALEQRGYEPLVDDAGVIRLGNCPFHRLAAEHRDLVCGMNEAFLQGLLAGLERDDLAARLDPLPGRCCVAIAPPAPS